MIDKKKFLKYKIIIIVLLALLAATCAVLGALLAVTAYADSDVEYTIIDDCFEITGWSKTMELEYKYILVFPAGTTKTTKNKVDIYSNSPTQLKIKHKAVGVGTSASTHAEFHRSDISLKRELANNTEYAYSSDTGASDIYVSYNYEYNQTALTTESIDLAFWDDGTYTLSNKFYGYVYVNNSAGTARFQGSQTSEIEYTCKIENSQTVLRVDCERLWQDDTSSSHYFAYYEVYIIFDESVGTKSVINSPVYSESNKYPDTLPVYTKIPSQIIVNMPAGGDDHPWYTCFYTIIDSITLKNVATGKTISSVGEINNGTKTTPPYTSYRVTIDIPTDIEPGYYVLEIVKHDRTHSIIGVNNENASSDDGKGTTGHSPFYFAFLLDYTNAPEDSYKAATFSINNNGATVYYGSDKWDDANPSEVYAFNTGDSAWFTEGHCADKLYVCTSVYTFYEAEKNGEGSFTGSNVTFYIQNMTWTDSGGNVYNNSYANGGSPALASATSSSGCVEIDFSKYRNGEFINSPPASGSTVEITLQYKCSWATGYVPITFSFIYGTILEVEQGDIGNMYYVSKAAAPSSNINGITSLSAKIPGSGKYEEIDLSTKAIDVGWDTDGWLIVRAEAENSDPVEVKTWVDHSDDYTKYTYLKLTGEGESGDGYQADYQKIKDPFSSGYYELSLMTSGTPANCTDGTVKNGEYLNAVPMGLYVAVPGETSAGVTHNLTLVFEGASHNQTVGAVIAGETDSTSTRLSLDVTTDDRLDLASGKYKMTLTDDIALAGVKETVMVTFTFTYDGTAPKFEYEETIKVGSTSTVLPNADVDSLGSYTYYTNSESLIVTDDVALAYLYFDYGGSGKYEKIALSGKSGETVALDELFAIGEGCYSFYITDLAGNISPTHTFVYDKTAPVVTLDESEASLSNGANIKVNVVDSSGTALVYYTQVEGSYDNSPKSENDIKTGTNNNGEKYTYVELSFDYDINTGYDLWVVVYDRAGNYASPSNASEYVGEVVSSIYLSTTGDYFTLDVGEEYSMTAYVEMTTRSEYKGDYKWAADSDAVEIIGSGADVVVLGVSEGNAMITVEVDNGFNASIRATVIDSLKKEDSGDGESEKQDDGGGKKDDGNNDDEGEKYTTPYIQSISVSPTYVELAVGGASRTISVSVQMSDSSDYKGAITWSTENADVVNVTGGGTSISVTAKKVGTAYLYVEAEGYKACCQARVVGEEDMTIPEQDEDGNFWFPDGWTGGTAIHSHGNSLKNLKWTDNGNCVTLTWDNDVVNVNYNGSFLVPDSNEKGEWDFDVCGEYRFMVYCRSCSEINELTFTIYHDYSKTVFDVADCTKSGKSYLECARDGCDSTKMEEYISPTNHTYISEITQEVDCEHDGVCKMTCSVCGYSYTYIYEKAWGHDETKTFVNPTCIENPQTIEERGGYYIIACSRDGCDLCEIEIVEGILPTEHTWSSTVTPATCEEDGCIYKVCEICGAESDEILPATGHSFVLYEIREELIYDEETGETTVTYYETDQCETCHVLSGEYKIEESKSVAEQIVEFFESYQTYVWWILLVCVAAWSIFFGVKYAVSRDDGETKAVSRQIVNYVLGILIIAAICVAVPYLIYGVAVFIA